MVTRQETKNQNMSGVGKTQGGEVGAQMICMEPLWTKNPGDYRYLFAGLGHQRGVKRTREMASDASR